MRRSECGSCGSGDLMYFLDLGAIPLADAYTETAEEESKRYPIELAVCDDCKLVQLMEVLDSKTLFGTGYSFYSSASPPLSAYHQDYAADILERHLELARRFTLEIGCNDGDMLRWMKAHRCNVLGVDPAEGPVSVAQSRGLSVLNTAFTNVLSHEIVAKRGKAGIIIANHVLAHVENVSDVLTGIATALADDGVAYVEVQYLPDLLVNNAFDLAYHEHRNFFSLTSLWNAVRRHGLTITSVQTTRRQLGSLRVTLRHERSNPWIDTRVTVLRNEESWLSRFSAYDGLQGRAERIRERLWDLMSKQSFGLAGFGAPAKATTLLNFCNVTNTTLSHVIDSTPAKQGRFIPNTGIPIVAPSTATVLSGTYLLLAWNYAGTIIPRYREHDVHWILPIPAPMLL